jgi:phage baseplate assembly protein gpV
MSAQKYVGKYRAIVEKIDDPEQRGRIRVQCPKVLGTGVSNWCEPCSPVAYDSGGDFALPPVGETVWVEFEEGDSNKPIWVGGWWSKQKTPSVPYSADVRVIEWKGTSLIIKVGDSSITLTKTGIVISSPRVDWN